MYVSKCGGRWIIQSLVNTKHLLNYWAKSENEQKEESLEVTSKETSQHDPPNTL